MPQNTVIDSGLSALISETESVLEDIFLSGFHSIRTSTLDQLTELFRQYECYGMEEGMRTISALTAQLLKWKDSFHGNSGETMTAYSRMEFYLEHLNSEICGSN